MVEPKVAFRATKKYFHHLSTRRESGGSFNTRSKDSADQQEPPLSSSVGCVSRKWKPCQALQNAKEGRTKQSAKRMKKELILPPCMVGAGDVWASFAPSREKGPPDMSFIALEAPKPESDRDLNNGAGERD